MKNENGYYKIFKRNKAFKWYLQTVIFTLNKNQRIKKKGLKNDFTRSFLRIYGGKNGKYIHDKECL